ncbi:protein sidekick-like isoform X5 [Varroa destructor]|uniref:Protein sidekick n=1 Tax=Varroa destructor TaxID=109461 RepID=A0A7M7JBS2_VARDE|nr:protein sidekick-like isoform X5 [Varroa destructor]
MGFLRRITLLRKRKLLLAVLSCMTVALADDSAPRITHGPLSGVVSKGGHGILTCRTSGVPPAQVRWLKNGQFVSNFSYTFAFKITGATDHDEGEYRCLAKNSVGSVLSKAAKVSIASIETNGPLTNRMTFTSPEGDVQILSKPAVRSVPRAIAQWTRDRTPIVSGDHYHVSQDQRLFILDAQQELRGEYRIELTNQVTGGVVEGPPIEFKIFSRSMSPTPKIVLPPAERVNLSVPPVGVQPVPSDVHVLECVANGHPISQLRTLWFKDGIELEYTGLPVLFEARNRSVILDKLSLDHAGMYECRVFLQTSYGPLGTDSAFSNVTVSTRPVVQQMPPERAIDTGSSLGLTCNATGHPHPEISWFRNGERLEQRGTYLEVNNSDEGGVYQCLARNWVGEDMSSTWVNVKRLQPMFVRRPQNVTALAGETFSLDCNATGAPQPRVRWVFNEQEPVESQGRFRIDPDTRSLTVSRAEVNNTGRYTCEMSNSAGRTEASAYVTVLSRTRIERPPQDSRVILGNTAVLQCGVLSDTKGGGEPELTWLFNGRPLPANLRVVVRDDGALVIRHARNTDIGNYTCQVTSPGGNDARTARLDVIELPHPPTFVHVTIVNEFPKTVNVSWAKSFDGNSPITSYIVERREFRTNQSEDYDLLTGWKEHQNNISADATWLLVGMLKPSVPYEFRVRAQNAVGFGQPRRAAETIILPAEAPGGPPTNVVVAARSPTSIVLQWNPPTEGDRNGAILGYAIRYRLAGYSGSTEAERRVNASQQLPFILDELIVWQTYEVRVAAFNEKGVGVFSEPLTVRTKEAPPQSPPTLRQVYAVNSTHIKVVWSPPDPQQINGINQGYKVEAWYNGEVEKSIRVGPSTGDPRDDQEEIFGGLAKYRSYNITVLCYTSAGDGPRSHGLTVCTKQDIPGPVKNMNFENVLDSSLELLWEPPEEPNGIILGYTINYWEEKDITTKLTEKAKSEIRMVFISGLKPLTSYVFEISANTMIGRGPPVVASIQSGIPPVLPEAPSNLAVSNIGPTSVVLQFHPGFNGNSSILIWHVQSQQGRNAELSKGEKMSSWSSLFEYKVEVDRRRRPNEIPASTQSITVPNLVPYTEYRLRLVAENVVGQSEPSSPTKFFETLQAPPTKPPQNVTVRSVNATALRVRWTPLVQADWCGVPKGYNISHRRLSSDDPHAVYRSELLTDHNANSFVIKDLGPFSQYEVIVAAVNDVGSSPWSNASTANTIEAPPSVSPSGLEGKATTSTTIVVSWQPLEKHYRNGDVLGYKISYRPLKQSSKPHVRSIDAGIEKTAYSTTLTELRKYTTYSIQVLAFTSAGDGPLSHPVMATTFEDVPGEPSNVSFPDVSMTTARIIWDVPNEPNGEILGYKVAHALLKQGVELTFTNKEVTPMERTLKVNNLRPNEYYVFSVTARTKEGWGQEVRAQVLTTSSRERPQAPSSPIVAPSQIQARQLTFTWAPGADGFAPLRYYLVQQYEPYSHKSWKTLPTKIDPQVTSFTVTGLRPSTVYQFRLEAVNDIGSSGWSAESNRTKTLPAAPERPPSGIVVTPYTTTSITVTWTPLDDLDWNGDTQTQLRGYRVVACLIASGVQLAECRSEEVRGQYSYNITIEDLIKDRDYEVRVFAVNAQGDSPASRTEKVAVGEAVPTGRPLHVWAETTSSTEIRVMWKSPPKSELNGALLGYKIFYTPFKMLNGSLLREQKEAVPVEPTQYTLMDLESFTNYSIQVLAFNPAGDGPRSDALIVQTQEDKPGPVTNLTFSQITMSSLLVSWQAPHNPNGIVLSYRLTYETTNSQGNEFSKQVKQKLNVTYLHVSGLRENLTYTFSVRAETICGYGPVLSKNVTTGPQKNSPEAPTDLVLKSTTISTTLSWRNSFGGDAPISGYLIEVKPATSSNEEEPWHTVVALDNGAQQSYTLSYQNLLPSMGYKLRLMARNQFGVSTPVCARDIVETPNKYYLELKRSMPFYREVWFLVMVAITTTIIIVLVATILCVKGSAYKYKRSYG